MKCSKETTISRNALRKIYAITGTGAFLFIASFWSSTVFSELFGSHEIVTAVEQTVVYALFGLAARMVTVDATDMKVDGKSKHVAIAAKRRRIPFIAADGVLILLSCAFFLNGHATAGQFDSVFYIVQNIGLIASAANLTLLGLSMKDGLSIREPKQKSTPLRV